MAYRTEALGQVAVFLLPSLKIRQPPADGTTPQERLERFLMDAFGGYTAEAGNIWGRWRADDGQVSLGEHRRFTVALMDQARLPTLEAFLARLAAELGEQTIYLEVGGEARLVHAADSAKG